MSQDKPLLLPRPRKEKEFKLFLWPHQRKKLEAMKKEADQKSKEKK